MVEPSPAPAEEPERGSLRSELERLAGSLESGDCTRKWASKFLWTIIEDLDGIYSTSPTTIREQAAEIERLKAALTTVARACGVESGSPSAEFLVSVIEGWKQLVTAYRDAEEPAAPQPEAKGASELPVENDEWRKRSIQEMREDIFGESPSTSLSAGDGEAEQWAVEAARVRDNGRIEFVVYRKSRELTQGDADDAADWLNRRAEVEAQLAKYKRDAEAWEKLERWKSEISYVPKAQQWAAWFYAGDATVCAHGDKPLDAVLALAAQLEQKGEG